MFKILADAIAYSVVVDGTDYNWDDAESIAKDINRLVTEWYGEMNEQYKSNDITSVLHLVEEIFDQCGCFELAQEVYQARCRLIGDACYSFTENKR